MNPSTHQSASIDEKGVGGILQAARNEGYREGWSQAAQCAHDEAYWRGREDAFEQAPSRIRWFSFGLTLTLLAAWWFA